MTSFPLLCLPDLPQMDILQYMPLDQVVKLSMCSRRMSDLVEDARIPIDLAAFSFFHVRRESSELTVDLGAREDTLHLIPHELTLKYPHLWYDSPIDHRWNGIKGVQVSSRNEPCNNLYHISECRDLLIKHVLKLFGRRMQSIRIEILSHHVRSQFAKYIGVEDTVHVMSKQLNISNCPEFAPAEMNTLLKRWIAMDFMENLKNLTIRWIITALAGSRSEVLKGIETVEWKPKEWKKKHFYHGFSDPLEWEDAVIIRRVDGFQAVVRITDVELSLVKMSSRY